MSVVSGANTSSKNLVFSFDGHNPKQNRHPSNQIAKWPWTLGTGSITGWGMNGPSAENERVVDYNPFNKRDIIWQSANNDAVSDADGGWNGVRVPIDNTKLYRFSTWVRKKEVLGNGRTYLGLYGYNASNVNTTMNNKTSSGTTNPYFLSHIISDYGASLDEWVLLTGHVWPVGTAQDGVMHVNSGIWRLDGTKLTSSADYIWGATHTQALHRSYQYYSTNVVETHQWWGPRMDLVDGKEPSLQDLLNGTDNTWNMAGTDPEMIGAYWDEASKSVVFNGTDAYMQYDATGVDFSEEQTILMVLKPTSFATRQNPYNQAYGGYGTITQEPSGSFNYYYGTNGGNAQSYYSIGSVAVPLNEPIMLTLTRDTANIRWYQNGVQTNTTVNQIAGGVTVSTVNNILIGDGYTNNWAGSMYHVSLYNRALTDEEVLKAYNSLKTRFDI